MPLPMRRSHAFFLLLIAFWASPARAEQSLFNVPSSEITQPGEVFFQEQLAYGDSLLQSNATFCYGLPHRMEVGLNVLNLDFNFAPAGAFIATNNADFSKALSPLVVANFQKVFEFSDRFRLGVGGQAGANVWGGFNDLHPLLLAYVNTVSTFFDDRLRVYAGAFVGNQFYLGDNGRDGAQFMLGMELLLVRDKLHLVADHLHGAHNVGVSVMGFTYYPKPGFALSAGLQLPNEGSGNSTGAVVELTWF